MRIVKWLTHFPILKTIKDCFETIDEETGIHVISKEGLAALKDPCKKRKIYEAIELAKENYNKTGVWEDPVVNFKDDEN